MPYGFPQDSWERAKEEALLVLQRRASRRHSQTISYTELVESLTAIQINPHDPRLTSFLEEIVVNEHTNGRPLVTVLVVHQRGDQMLGDGFYEIVVPEKADIFRTPAFRPTIKTARSMAAPKSDMAVSKNEAKKSSTA